MKNWEEKIDKKIVNFMKKIGLPFSRFALAVVFIWFGALKIISISPASELVAKTIYWFNPNWFVPFLGFWEVLIGICFLYKPLLRFGILIMSIQMLGTFLPLIILPDITFSKFLVPTLEGQYIIKNLVLIACAIVVGSSVRNNKK